MEPSASNRYSPTPKQTRWKENTKRVAQVTGNGALLFLSSVKESSDVFPPLKSTAAAILVLADLISSFHRNKDEWNDLGRIVAERVTGIAKHIGNDPSPELIDSLESLNRVLKSITDEVQRMQNRNQVTRALSIQADKEKIASFYTRMKNELDTLSLIANLTVFKLAGNSNPPPPAGPLEADVNWNPPPPPIHFYGRDGYLATMISIIQKKISTNAGAHLLIRGPGGVGKTSVAQSLFHHPTIESLFSQNRYFVRCEAASNQSLLLSTIASALHLDITRKDALGSILICLHSGTEPLLLVLDNAETFWHTASRADVRTVLQHLGTIKRITLIMTMRGIEQPTAVKWGPLPPLDSLSLEAARETFLAIAEIPDSELSELNAKESDPDTDASLISPDPETASPLDLLLNEVDRLPLAITLLARIHQTGGSTTASSITHLHKRLLEERSDLMSMGSDYIDREDNIGISIKLSLESQLMIQNPSALRLLKLLALLPTGVTMANLESNAGFEGDVDSRCRADALGISEFGSKPLTAMSLSSIRKGAHTLKHLLLASESNASSRLYSLSPVRLYILKHHPPHNEDLQNLQHWYLGLAASARSTLEGDEYPPTLNTLKQEKGNISFILDYTIEKQEGIFEEPLLIGILGFSRFLTDFDIPSSDLLELVITNFRKGIFKNRSETTRIVVAASISILGHIKHKRSDLSEAEELLAEAGAEFKALDHSFNVAESFYSLGATKLAMNKYSDALECLESAKKMFESLGRPYNVAICLENIGCVNRSLGKYNEAEASLKKALVEFRKPSSHVLGSQYNAARCLYDLGGIRIDRMDFHEAEKFLSQAQSEFENVGDRAGIANCLQSLGNAKRLQLKFPEAQSLLIKARKEFKELGYRSEAACCLYDLGDMNRYQHNYVEAQRYLEGSRKEYEFLSDQRMASNCVYSLGEMMFDQGKYEEARQLVRESMGAYKALGRPYDIARCLYSLGNLAKSQFNYSEAERLLKEAKLGFESTGHPFNAALCANKLGELKSAQEEYVEAEQHFLEAKTLLQPLNRPYELGKVLRNFAGFKTKQGNLSESEQLYCEAVASFQAVGYQKDAIVCLFHVGDSKRMQSQYNAAQVILEQVIAACRAAGMQYITAASLYAIGELKMDRRLEEASSGLSISTAGESDDEIYLGARSYFSESIEILRQLPTSEVKRGDLGMRLMKFGGYALIVKDYEIAQPLLEESQQIFRSAGLESQVQMCQSLMSTLPHSENTNPETTGEASESSEFDEMFEVETVTDVTTPTLTENDYDYTDPKNTPVLEAA